MRNFFAVGNGLFAMECIKGMTSVYDCGSTNQATIDLAINRARTLHQGLIDNVFISHYDKDHINGLLTLLNVFQVKRVILPMVSELAKVISSSTVKDSFQYNLILSPESVIREISPQTDVIYVEHQDDGENNQEVTRRIELQELKNGMILRGNLQIYGINDWQYVIYNKKVLTYAELTTFYRKIGLSDDPTTDEIIYALQSMTKATTLKKALSCVFQKADIRKINDYSMVVWSGRINYSLGCLYTGDYNAKDYVSELQKIYRHLLPVTDIIQIPHHGSRHNFDPGICGAKATHVVSARKGPYSHQIVDPRRTINAILKLGYKCRDTRYGDVML